PGTGCLAHRDDDRRQRSRDPLCEPLGGGSAAQPAAAHAENAQIRQALDASRTAMMIADNDHVIRYVNRSVVALLRN
ncbi:hypothetical protein C7E12_22435, partial [Stenotrophomonas maltophilia]